MDATNTSSTPSRNEPIAVEATPRGILRHEGRNYTVHALESVGGFTGENGRSLALCVLRGRRGAEYLLTDNGPGYRLTAWNMGTNTSARRIIGCTPFDRAPIARAVVLAALTGGAQ